MSAILACGCSWQPNCPGFMKIDKRIMKFLAHSVCTEAIIVARNEIKAYASAVSGLEVVGKAT